VSSRVLAADEDAALAEAVARDVGPVLGTGADVGAVALGVTGDVAARAVGTAVLDEVAGEAGEDVLDGRRIGVEAVGAARDVAAGHALNALPRCLGCLLGGLLFFRHCSGMLAANGG